MNSSRDYTKRKEMNSSTDYMKKTENEQLYWLYNENGARHENHTPSIAFRHLPPNSARFSSATEGALFISAQLSNDAVSALRKVRVLIFTVEAT